MMLVGQLANLVAGRANTDDMKQFQNMRNRFAQEGSDEFCLPVLDSICGLNIAWCLLVVLFLWFSTMGGIAALMPSAPAEEKKEKNEASKDKDGKKEKDESTEEEKEDEDEDEDEDEKDEKTKQDDKKESKPKKKEDATNSSGANMYFGMLSVVCVAMVCLGAYQILNPGDPYAHLGDQGMPDKFGRQRVYEEDDGTDGIATNQRQEQQPHPTQKKGAGATQGSCGSEPPAGSDCGGGGNAAAGDKKKTDVKTLSGGRRLEYTFELNGFGDANAMKAYADANDVVGSVKAEGGRIHGRVQAVADKLQGMREWMEGKGTLGAWDEALKHPLKKFEIKTGGGH